MLTAISVVVMPLLGWAKLRTAAELGSGALRADAYEASVLRVEAKQRTRVTTRTRRIPLQIVIDFIHVAEYVWLEGRAGLPPRRQRRARLVGPGAPR